MKLSVELKCGYSMQQYLLAVDDVTLTASSLRNICVKRKQHDFNCTTFTLIDIIETLLKYFAFE